MISLTASSRADRVRSGSISKVMREVGPIAEAPVSCVLAEMAVNAALHTVKPAIFAPSRTLFDAVSPPLCSG
jgi:hypothetical protein